MVTTEYSFRDPFQSVVDQVAERLRKTSPAMFQTLENVRSGVNLKPFRERFAGNDKDVGELFDARAGTLVNLVFHEASLR